MHVISFYKPAYTNILCYCFISLLFYCIFDLYVNVNIVPCVLSFCSYLFSFVLDHLFLPSDSLSHGDTHVLVSSLFSYNTKFPNSFIFFSFLRLPFFDVAVYYFHTLFSQLIISCSWLFFVLHFLFSCNTRRRYSFFLFFLMSCSVFVNLFHHLSFTLFLFFRYIEFHLHILLQMQTQSLIHFMFFFIFPCSFMCMFLAILAPLSLLYLFFCNRFHFLLIFWFHLIQ